jgi:hypothetical protein
VNGVLASWVGIYTAGFLLALFGTHSLSLCVLPHSPSLADTVVMVQILSLALCSAFVGWSSAAGLGSAEEYADGSVHARIMGMKMV